MKISHVDALPVHTETAATDALDLLGTLSDVTKIAIIIFSFCSLKE